MTDNQDSVTAGAAQPATDRPLTAGDVPLLREGDLIKGPNGKTYRFEEWGDGGFLTFIDEPFDGFLATLCTFVSRPATSAASEGAVDRVMAVLNHWFDGRMRVDRNSEMVAQLAALASPPVSERERELEGALIDLVSWFTKPVQGLDGAVWAIPAGDQGADDAIEQARVLTAQPAGEGK